MVRIALIALSLVAQEKDPWEAYPKVPDNTWVSVGSVETGSVWLVRAKDIGSTDSGATVWVKIDASRDRTVNWRSALHEYSISCRERSMQQTSTIVYDARGGVLASSQPGYRAFANRGVVPDSLGEAVLEAVCTKK